MRVRCRRFPPSVEKTVSEFRADEERVPLWDIRVPVKQLGATAHSPQRVIGMVHVLVSLKRGEPAGRHFLEDHFYCGGISVVVFILVLTFFLRKTVANERKLRVAEDQNLQLSRQLHEAERQLMNVEKLAVMGQLTANLAARNRYAAERDWRPSSAPERGAEPGGQLRCRGGLGAPLFPRASVKE